MPGMPGKRGGKPMGKPGGRIGIGIPGRGGIGIMPGGIGRIPIIGGGGRCAPGGGAVGSAGWKFAQYSMTFMMCLRPEWCCLRPGTDECVSAMSQYSQ